ncbi:MAG: DNA mismatch repair endonuclease MutL [Chloroflexota bacterium]|nr:DNA mismatch repair endonuclease MutL [Chloroflexota bacterium]
MSLRLLDERTIGKIAAGEVVERPVSVVKELLENALDAGATRIRVAVRGGGIELIEVVDDGYGIAPVDLSLAVQRHATSKLSAFEDLDSLTTLGFRGEALPSVGAVSSLAIRSRTQDASHASLLRVTFGDVSPAVSVGAAIGTAVTARDLFGNVPARRKFLRQPGTETGYIQRAVAAYAASYPAVAFELTIDGRRAFASDGSGDAVAAATAAFGPDVGQAALLLEPLDESAAVPGMSVAGWITSPELSRSHRQKIVIFVNGRWVQNRALGFALEEAYHSLLLVGRHPLAAVHIRLDPAAVDVNVHPTKSEVKFVDERAACRALQRAVHTALARRSHDDLPLVRFAPIPTTPAARQRPIPFTQPRFISPQREPLASEEESSAPLGAASSHPSGVPLLRVLGQITASFIIAEGPDGMYLIDQHAAHERVLYERILNQMRERAVDRQTLLDPMVVDLTPHEMAAFERSTAELSAIGFEIERWDGGAVAVRAVPALAKGVDIAERLRLILRGLADGGQGESWLDAVAVSTACHTSIRAGQALSIPEMRELVSALERSSQPRACGHGRPTMLHLSGSDLEKQFQRR